MFCQPVFVSMRNGPPPIWPWLEREWHVVKESPATLNSNVRSSPSPTLEPTLSVKRHNIIQINSSLIISFFIRMRMTFQTNPGRLLLQEPWPPVTSQREWVHPWLQLHTEGDLPSCHEMHMSLHSSIPKLGQQAKEIPLFNLTTPTFLHYYLFPYPWSRIVTSLFGIFPVERNVVLAIKLTTMRELGNRMSAVWWGW